MEMKAWITGALWVLIIVLLGFMVYFRKKKKTTRFYMARHFNYINLIFLCGICSGR